MSFYDEAEKDIEATSGEQAPAIKWDEPGKVLKGVMLAIKTQGTKDGRMNLLATIDEAGTEDTWAVWIGDSPFMLKQEFEDAAPAIGSKVMISYIGKQPTKSGDREYRVFRVRAETKDFELWLDLHKQKAAKLDILDPTSSRINDGLDAPF